jgi:hypothetical protein
MCVDTMIADQDIHKCVGVGGWGGGGGSLKPSRCASAPITLGNLWTCIVCDRKRGGGLSAHGVCHRV